MLRKGLGCHGLGQVFWRVVRCLIGGFVGRWVSNGKSIKFWEDKWVASSKFFWVKSRKPSGCNLFIVSEAINSTSRCWNKTVLHSLVSHEEVEEICVIPIAIEDQNDRFIWYHDPKGTYSVKSGYRVEIEYQQHQAGDWPSSFFLVPEHVWKFMWTLPIPPKCRHFWWRACNNLLASKANLFWRRCAKD